MQCPSCGFENPDQFKFCGECGTPLTGTCPACDFQNPPGLKFCGNCGASLAPSGETPRGTVPPKPQSPPTTHQPTSFANDRYQVKEFLGEGGNKRVYLAQDTLLDREVAFALIKAEGPYSRRGLSHIFISHVHEDSPLAIELADALEAKGYSTWHPRSPA